MQQTWCWNITVFWDVTTCSLVIIYRTRGWKRCPHFMRKFLQFCVRLYCGAGAGLQTEGSGPPGRGKVRKWRGQNITQDGRWSQMPSTRLITTKLHLILARKTETYTIYSSPPCPIPERRDPVSCTGFLPSLDGTLRWRVTLCSAVCGGYRTESSNSALLNHVRCWNF